MIITFTREDFTPYGLFEFQDTGIFDYAMLKSVMQWRLGRANEAYIDIYDKPEDKKAFNDDKYRVEDGEILKVRALWGEF